MSFDMSRPMDSIPTSVRAAFGAAVVALSAGCSTTGPGIFGPANPDQVPEAGNVRGKWELIRAGQVEVIDSRLTRGGIVIGLNLPGREIPVRYTPLPSDGHDKGAFARYAYPISYERAMTFVHCVEGQGRNPTGGDFRAPQRTECAEYFNSAPTSDFFQAGNSTIEVRYGRCDLAVLKNQTVNERIEYLATAHCFPNDWSRATLHMRPLSSFIGPR